MLDLVGNPEDRFSGIAVQMVCSNFHDDAPHIKIVPPPFPGLVSSDFPEI